MREQITDNYHSLVISDNERRNLVSRSHAIVSLFLGNVVATVATPEMYNGGLFADEKELARFALPKRLSEFTAGRNCIRECLKALGTEAVPVLSGAHREPILPSGIVGSITHCKGFCCAVAAHKSDIYAMGVDAEPWTALDPGIVKFVCSQAELEKIRLLPLPNHGDWKKVIFCAKEAFFKCLFLEVGRYFGFLDVEVELQPIDLNRGSYRANFVRGNFAESFHPNRFTGRWRFHGGHILASAFVLNTECSATQ